MWMNSLMQEQRGRRNPRSQRRLLKGIFSAYRLEVGFTRLLWGGVDVHLHIASKTKRLPHAAPFTISGLMALRCRFTKPAPWDKYNFIFNIWSGSALFTNNLLGGWNHFKCYWKLHMYRPRDFIFVLRYFQQNLPTHTVLLDGGTCENSKGGDLDIRPCYTFLLYPSFF